jgi:hypothetical protein
VEETEARIYSKVFDAGVHHQIWQLVFEQRPRLVRHQWTRAGKPVGKPFNNSDLDAIAVSPDGLMVVGKCGDVAEYDCGR